MAIDKAWSGVPRSARTVRVGVLAAGLISGLVLGPATGITADASVDRSASALTAVPPQAARPAVVPARIDGGTLVTGTGSSKGYHLLRNSDGSVVRWNPCAPVHYRVNLSRAPKGAAADVAEAVRRTSRATGIRFVYDGTTKVVPQSSYGSDARPWEGAAPPLVIAWAAPGKGAGRTDALSGSGDELGVGGWRSAWWTVGATRHKPRIVTGYIVVSTKANATLKPGFRGTSRGSVLLHELGHVMGLDHVGDTAQLMYPRITGRSGFGRGDLTGLKLVGRTQGCLA